MDEISAGLEAPDPAGLKSLKARLNRLSHLDEALDLAAGIRHRLGEMLLHAGRIDSAQLDAAVAEQHRTGEALGRILVRKGWLDPRELDGALEFQRRQAGEVPASGPLKLGEILVATGQIRREHLEQGLSRQRLSGKRLGEELVEAGHVQPHQIAGALQLQQKLVTAALIALLALSAQAVPANAAAGPNSTVAVTATVLNYTHIRVLTQPESVVITEDDAALGYVDVPAASQVEINSNSPDGYMLVFESQSDFVRATLVRGLGDEVRLDATGGVVAQPSSGPGRVKTTVALGFRFVLERDARPGIYAWPMQMSIMPR